MDAHVKQGGEDFFKGFYARCSRQFWFYVYKICGDEHMADDIFQESFYRFLRAEPEIKEDSHLRCYLYKIAFRLMIDKKRRKKLERRILEEKRASTVSGENLYAEGAEDQRSFSMDMEKVFQTLKPKMRNLLWLAYVEGYAIQEIAEITGAEQNTVKTQLFRARKKLAGLLKKKEYLGREAKGLRGDEA